MENGLYPAEIFAATFTNKAAREMRTRVESLTGLPVEGMWIGTFHSMCARILRREGRPYRLPALLYHLRYRRPAQSA